MLFMLAKYWLSSVKQAIFNITFYASHKLVGKLQRSLTSFLLTGMPKNHSLSFLSIYYKDSLFNDLRAIHLNDAQLIVV